MVQRERTSHDMHLQHLAHNPTALRIHDIEFVLPEPIWLWERSKTQRKLCDLLIGFFEPNEHNILLVEVKAARSSLDCAKKQLKSARTFVQNRLYPGIEDKNISQLVTYYNQNKKYYECDNLQFVKGRLISANTYFGDTLLQIDK